MLNISLKSIQVPNTQQSVITQYTHLQNNEQKNNRNFSIFMEMKLKF